jgi:leader peptidase (prepilin peptidase)/N-methyltransferase
MQHLGFFLVGACVGSFLNVVIYRLPLGMSVNEPRRSFCPSCRRQLPAHENIPIVGWLILRGRCAGCKQKIAVRYPVVELLVAIAFLAASLAFPLWHALVLTILFALLVAATFIDIDHFIIPHSINIIGAVAGLVASMLVPSLQGEEAAWQGLGRSVMGGLSGMLLLWLVVEAGKLAFGKKKLVLEKPEPWSITQPDDREPPRFQLGEEVFDWWDLFARKNDRLVIESGRCVLNGSNHPGATLEVTRGSLEIASENYVIDLGELKSAQGTARTVVIPREAMGLGDVWFLGMIGTFVGPVGVLFTVGASAMIGSIIPVVMRLAGRAQWGARIPYGPYLAAAAVIWIFRGEWLIDWYLDLVLR